MAGVLENLSSDILGTTAKWADIPNAIIGWVTPLILAGLTISIMWQGYKIVRGAGGQDHLLDVFFNSTRTFLVVALCLTAGAYSANVIGLLQELRDQLTGLFSGGPKNTYAVLDTSIGQAVDSYKLMWKWGVDNTGITNLSGLTAIIGGGVMVLAVLLYCVLAAVSVLIIDFSLAALFAVGPLFVACLAFQSTASYFNTWFTSALKNILTAVVITAVVGLGTASIAKVTKILTEAAPKSLDYISMTFTSLATAIVLIILTKQAATIASEMAGGAALHIASLAQAGRWAVNPTGAALSAAGKVAGAGAGHVAGRAAGAVAKTAAGQAIGGSPAMRAAMTGVNAMSHMTGGAKRAMSHRNVVSAARAGFQSGSSASHGRGTITK